MSIKIILFFPPKRKGAHVLKITVLLVPSIYDLLRICTDIA